MTLGHYYDDLTELGASDCSLSKYGNTACVRNNKISVKFKDQEEFTVIYPSENLIERNQKYDRETDTYTDLEEHEIPYITNRAKFPDCITEISISRTVIGILIYKYGQNGFFYYAIINKQGVLKDACVRHVPYYETEAYHILANREFLVLYKANRRITEEDLYLRGREPQQIGDDGLIFYDDHKFHVTSSFEKGHFWLTDDDQDPHGYDRISLVLLKREGQTQILSLQAQKPVWEWVESQADLPPLTTSLFSYALFPDQEKGYLLLGKYGYKLNRTFAVSVSDPTGLLDGHGMYGILKYPVTPYPYDYNSDGYRTYYQLHEPSETGRFVRIHDTNVSIPFTGPITVTQNGPILVIYEGVVGPENGNWAYTRFHYKSCMVFVGSQYEHIVPNFDWWGYNSPWVSYSSLAATHGLTYFAINVSTESTEPVYSTGRSFEESFTTYRVFTLSGVKNYKLRTYSDRYYADLVMEQVAGKPETQILVKNAMVSEHTVYESLLPVCYTFPSTGSRAYPASHLCLHKDEKRTALDYKSPTNYGYAYHYDYQNTLIYCGIRNTETEDHYSYSQVWRHGGPSLPYLPKNASMPYHYRNQYTGYGSAEYHVKGISFFEQPLGIMVSKLEIETPEKYQPVMFDAEVLQQGDGLGSLSVCQHIYDEEHLAYFNYNKRNGSPDIVKIPYVKGVPTVRWMHYAVVNRAVYYRGKVAGTLAYDIPSTAGYAPEATRSARDDQGKFYANFYRGLPIQDFPTQPNLASYVTTHGDYRIFPAGSFETGIRNIAVIYKNKTIINTLGQNTNNKYVPALYAPIELVGYLSELTKTIQNEEKQWFFFDKYLFYQGTLVLDLSEYIPDKNYTYTYVMFAEEYRTNFAFTLACVLHLNNQHRTQHRIISGMVVKLNTSLVFTVTHDNHVPDVAYRPGSLSPFGFKLKGEVLPMSCDRHGIVIPQRGFIHSSLQLNETADGDFEMVKPTTWLPFGEQKVDGILDVDKYLTTPLEGEETE